MAIKNKGWSFKPIDIICFTHFHADHISGLPGLLLTIGNAERTEPITIIGPKGVEKVVNSIRIIAPELPFKINFIELREPKEVIEVNGYKIISDCYNSNLEACSYALKALGLYKNRKIAVLGTIGQLADYADEGHGTLGVCAYESGIDIIVTVGEHTDYINKYAEDLGFDKNNSYHFDNKEDAVKLLKSIIKPDDVILVKASHFNNFDYIVEELKKM